MPTTKKSAVDEQEVPKKAPRKRVAKKDADSEVVKPTDEAVVAEHAEIAAAEVVKGGSFIATVGRRKTSVARVRLIKNGKGAVIVNGKPANEYFNTFVLREQVVAPLKAVGQDAAVDVSAKVNGGGIRGQAEAVRHGVSRALIELNPTFRTVLKKLGYLTRDPRKRERKKFGKKSARRSPQWSKR